MKRTGPKSSSQTPAPTTDRIKGSKTNAKGTAKNSIAAKSIVFNDSLETSIKNKLSVHNTKYPSKKVSLATAKAVVRRGFGAYSVTHRPNISRTAWGLARLNKFLEKKAGKTVKAAYIQDDDLL